LFVVGFKPSLTAKIGREKDVRRGRIGKRSPIYIDVVKQGGGIEPILFWLMKVADQLTEDSVEVDVTSVWGAAVAPGTSPASSDPSDLAWRHAPV
jgi:hypothetical protein